MSIYRKENIAPVHALKALPHLFVVEIDTNHLYSFKILQMESSFWVQGTATTFDFAKFQAPTFLSNGNRPPEENTKYPGEGY